MDHVHTGIDYEAVLADLPAAEHWPRLREWLRERPAELTAFLRERHPILETPDCVLLSAHEDVVEALERPEIFSVELYKPKMGSYLMTEDRTRRHDEDKAIMAALLAREDIAAVRRFVAGTAEAIVARGERLDLVNDYGRRVPVAMVQEVFGLDGVAPEKLIEWSYWNQYSAFRNQHVHVANDSPAVERSKRRNNVMMGLYIARLMLRKWWRAMRGRSDDDPVTRVLSARFPTEGSLQVLRRGINIGGLLIGAVETTSEAVAHIVSELGKRSGAFADARRLSLEDDTDAFDRLCWEALRQRPIAPYIMRKLASDYTFTAADGTRTELRRGRTVLCLIASAMLDESAVANAAAFDRRREFGTSFHFGHGHHACLGRAFGMVLVPEMVRQLFRRPGLALAGDIEYLGKPFPERFALTWAEPAPEPAATPVATALIDDGLVT